MDNKEHNSEHYWQKLMREIDITFPKDFVFTKNDWRDLHETLCAFKLRVMSRRPPIEVEEHYQNQCPFCDKIDVVDDMGHCSSCGKLTRPPIV